MATTIGILGFGRFGRLMGRYLAEDFSVLVYSRNDRSQEILQTGSVPASLPQVCSQDVVILGVPISTMKSVLARINPLISNKTLVVDVCSVKERPVRWMKALLPPHIPVLATHPMFGPDSASDSLKGCKIVLCPIRIDARRYAKIKTYLASKGLVTIETTPDIHDRQIAVSLALTHFIGRSLSEFGSMPLEIDTEGYQRLLHTLEVVSHDTWQLFQDMHTYNRYAARSRKAFIDAMVKIDKKLSRNSP